LSDAICGIWRISHLYIQLYPVARNQSIELSLHEHTVQQYPSLLFWQIHIAFTMRLCNLSSLLRFAVSAAFASAISITSTKTYDIAIDPEGPQSLNGVSFQQDALATFGNYQYIAFYNTTSWGYSSHYVNLGRRQISPSIGTWQYLTLTDYEQTKMDGHNIISMGISGDGRIHLSFDQHVRPFRQHRWKCCWV
jgi:hypothetical protein